MGLFTRHKPHDYITVAEYLEHMGAAFAIASFASPSVIMEALKGDLLDGEVLLAEHSVAVDGASLVPEGVFGLDELEIECESDVELARDENGKIARDVDGNIEGLAMTMKRGLRLGNMRVKFRAKYTRHDKLEGVEILRDAANGLLTRQMEQANIPVKRPEKRS